MNTKQLTRLLILFLLAFIWASSPAISHAQSKKKPKKQQSVDDDFDLDGDDLEKELEQLETEEIKELDAEAPAPAETPAVQEEQPAQAGDDEFLEEEEAPAPAPVAKPPSGKPVAKQKAAPEPPPPEEQPDEMIPEPSQELEEEVAKPEPIPEPAPEPVVRAEIAPVYVEDVPDEEYEARLRRIYQQFYAAAIPDEEWTGIIGDRAQEIYEVQKGDTLWGISVTFFGNGFFWPKLWQLNNSSITNPHTIEVGDKIVFSMGTLGQEPAVKVAREEDQEIIVKETETSPEPQKVIVKGRTRFNPVLEALPPSLPETSIESSKYDASGFAITAVKSPQIPDPFPILGILTDEPPAVDGQIIDVETGGNTAGMFQKVFVRLRKGGVGDIFSAFVVRKALGGGFIYSTGVPIEFQGEVEVTESLGDNLYKGIVITNFDMIETGAKLASGPVPEGDNSGTGRVNYVTTRVLGGPLDDQRTLFGLNSIIYLEGGSLKGVQVGDLLNVLRNDSLRTATAMVVRSTATIGKIKILNVSKKFSTGVVVVSHEDIRPGDRTGKGIEPD